MPDIKTTEREFAIKLIGWQGKEGKIVMTEEKQTTYVCLPDWSSGQAGLADHERKNAQMQR